jgi:hypothetical protein
MSRRVEEHDPRQPAERVHRDVSAAVFFPGEVARLLRLGNVEYDQLRKLFVLARVLRGEPHPGRRWSRFTLGDLAAIEVLVALGGGRPHLASGKRLVLGEVVQACRALREVGIENPLLQVPMVRIGRRVFARVEDYLVEPTTGQLALAHVGDCIAEFLEERLITDSTVRAAIAREARLLRQRGRVRAQLPREGSRTIRIVAG